MPVREKINNILHRKNSAPEAPALPEAPLTQHAVATEPITNSTLLHQREVLAETRVEQGTMANSEILRDEAPVLHNQPLLAQHNTVVQPELYTAGDRTSVGLSRQEPTIIERIEKDVVVHERIHPVEKEEIQPVIYREREQLDVKQVTQLMHETQIQPTLIEQRELAPEIREAVIERSAPLPENVILPTREVNATSTTQVVHAPIVEEVIRKTVIEEVQPVVERDVYVPTIIQQTQAIHEKIIEAPNVTREVRQVQELGTRGLGNETIYTGGLASTSQYQQEHLHQQNLLSQQTTLTQEQLLHQQNLQARTGLSNSEYLIEQQQLLAQQQHLLAQQQNVRVLPTGQVLPEVASSRPAYAYLPAGSVEKRPDFVGTSSQYTAAAGTLPLTHNKGLPTQATQGYPMYAPAQPAPVPQAYLRQ